MNYQLSNYICIVIHDGQIGRYIQNFISRYTGINKLYRLSFQDLTVTLNIQFIISPVVCIEQREQSKGSHKNNTSLKSFPFKSGSNVLTVTTIDLHRDIHLTDCSLKETNGYVITKQGVRDDGKLEQQMQKEPIFNSFITLLNFCKPKMQGYKPFYV